MDPYTLHPGARLELDESAGRKDGPRIIDATAGCVRFADASMNIPFEALRAVAVLWVERELFTLTARTSGVFAPQWVHVVSLVPRRCPDAVAATLDRIERGDPDPTGFFVLGAARDVDRAAVHVMIASSAADARRGAKAIARLARLPVVELYGERTVYRPVNALDSCLRDELANEPPRPEPGPPPKGGAGALVEGDLVLSFAWPPPRVGRFVVTGAALGAAAIVSFILREVAFGIACLVVAIAIVVYATRARRPELGRLVIGTDRVEWTRRGARATAEVGALEMIRVYEATLILVGQEDEVRVDLPSAALAEWARGAIEHRLGARQTGYR